jgi:hypothetical protein
MKKYLTLLFVAAGLLLTVFAYSQSSQLSGEWTLESVTVVQNDNGSTTNLDVNAAKERMAYGLYDKLIFSGEQLTLFSGETSSGGQVTITPNLIQSDATPVPLLFVWKMEQDKLHLEYEQDAFLPDRTNVSYKVSSVYIKQ